MVVVGGVPKNEPNHFSDTKQANQHKDEKKRDLQYREDFIRSTGSNLIGEFQKKKEGKRGT